MCPPSLVERSPVSVIEAQRCDYAKTQLTHGSPSAQKLFGTCARLVRNQVATCRAKSPLRGG